MIVDKIRDYFAVKDRPDYKTALSPKEIGSIFELAALRTGNAFRYQFLPPDPTYTRAGKLYPSAATKCTRSLMYGYLGFPSEPLSARASFTFFYGQILEAGLLAAASLAGVKITDNNALMEILIGGDFHRGRSDGIYWEEDYRRRNVEIKGMSGYSYGRFLREGLDDSWGYKGQINVYMRHMLAANLINEPAETVYVAINKDNLDMCEKIEPYNAQYAIEADENFAAVKKAIAAKKQPARPVKRDAKGVVLRGELLQGNVLPIGCSYCGHKHTCWTYPKQVIRFDEGGSPILSAKTEQFVAVEYKKKDRWGAVKPQFRVIDA